ncbi:MAG: hypothetical protein WD648_01585 [Planctomycetaceae bacterium]
MSRLFLANLDFEHQLGRQPQGNLSASVKRLNEELAAAWVGIADDGDYLWLPAAISADFFSGLVDQGLPAVRPVTNAANVEQRVEFCPWGWTSSLRKWAEQHQWNFAAPEQDVVTLANSRRFSAGLEAAWSVGLNRAVVAHSLKRFVDAVAAMPGDDAGWVAKAEFGMSARERVLGRGREASAAAIQWVDKRLKSDGVVFVEPWVEKLEEAGLQFTIHRSGTIVFEGLSGLLTDAAGQYRGSRFAADDQAEARWMPAIETGLRAARELQQLGYFGPLGIDAVRYRDELGNPRMRPLQDINARYTMGRLSLGFRRLLSPGEQGSWLHVRWPDNSESAAARWVDEVRSRLAAGVRLIPTSPFAVGGRPTAHGTLVVIAPTRQLLTAAEDAVFSAA